MSITIRDSSFKVKRRKKKPIEEGKKKRGNILLNHHFVYIQKSGEERGGRWGDG